MERPGTVYNKMSSNEISFGSRPDRQLGYLLSNFTKPARAFIPGCGFGGTVLSLLESGWQVVGLDKHQEALDFIEKSASQDQRKKLKLICADLIDYNFSKNSLKAQLEAANSLQVPYALILGQKEVQDGTIIIRDMESGVQEIVDQKKLEHLLKKKIVRFDEERKK